MQNPLAGGLKPKPSSSPHMAVSMKNVDSAFHGAGQKAYPLAQVYFCIFAIKNLFNFNRTNIIVLLAISMFMIILWKEYLEKCK